MGLCFWLLSACLRVSKHPRSGSLFHTLRDAAQPVKQPANKHAIGGVERDLSDAPTAHLHFGTQICPNLMASVIGSQGTQQHAMPVISTYFRVPFAVFQFLRSLRSQMSSVREPV
mmetsp:Transcript_12859/g.23339  ORF Transcript_12859/g.23339 Transcript_12859/m.23339 type:complete len:115 (+) Transcript_12859:1230-1574(+)